MLAAQFAPDTRTAVRHTAERHGAQRGSVSDIFLPDVVAENLTWSASTILVIGIGLNARAMRRGRVP